MAYTHICREYFMRIHVLVTDVNVKEGEISYNVIKAIIYIKSTLKGKLCSF